MPILFTDGNLCQPDVLVYFSKAYQTHSQQLSFIGLVWQLFQRPQKPTNVDIHEFCRYRPIYNALKKSCTSNVMLCLSKVMLHPCLVIFVHRVALAALLSRPKSIKMLISPFVISFRKFYQSNMLVYLSASLLDHSITFVCVGTFLQSLENVRAHQFGATTNAYFVSLVPRKNDRKTSRNVIEQKWSQSSSKYCTLQVYTNDYRNENSDYQKPQSKFPFMQSSEGWIF